MIRSYMCQKIIIDGGIINTEFDFHCALANALDFGVYYGNNTDALWDWLSSGMACGVCLHWKQSAVSREKLGVSFDVISDILKRTKDRYQGKGAGKEFNFILE